MRLLLLFATLLLPIVMPGLTVAQFVDEYGNSLDHLRSYYTPRGSAGYRQPDGRILTPPILPSHDDPWARSAPADRLAPSTPPRQDRYEMLRDTTPGSSYADPLFSDRVSPRRPY